MLVSVGYVCFFQVSKGDVNNESRRGEVLIYWQVSIISQRLESLTSEKQMLSYLWRMVFGFADYPFDSN